MLSSSQQLRDAISSVITDRFPAAEWEQAFATARSAHGGKVVLSWT
jgi:threonine 3-dehydrogenase